MTQGRQLVMSGAEFKRFIDDEQLWPEVGAIYENAFIFVDGQDSPGGADLDPDDLQDTARVLVCSGVLTNAPAEMPADLVEAIRWWRMRSPTVEFMLTVPLEKVEAMQHALSSIGLTPTPLA